jgi:putative RNA 2'-phosphotransferase
MKDLVRLSKTLSLALRHRPQDFGIVLDSEGWAPLSILIDSLRERPAFRDLTLVDIEMILGNFEKKRFELDESGDRIRAYYGHSVPQKIERTPAEPPDYLYHGTSPDALDKIKSEGLKPMGRQDVHLSTIIETARKTGARKHPHPVILMVYAKRAYGDGIKFYQGNQDVWLSEPIPSGYISPRFSLGDA